MRTRVVIPEILDRLDASDPAAVRSRRDLARINLLMGNERWIVRQVSRFPREAHEGIVELGAGEGRLLRKLSRLGPATGIDLAPRPPGLECPVTWMQRDVLGALDSLSGGIIVGCLFLHHFDDARLSLLSAALRRFKVVCIAEPHRSRLALACGWLLLPFVNQVTRHDMPVSIRAGFVPGQLSELLGLRQAGWRIHERTALPGGLRLLALAPEVTGSAAVPEQQSRK